MILNYTTMLDLERNILLIEGFSLKGNKFILNVSKDENGNIDFKGKRPLDLYNDKTFVGGEWLYFDMQLDSYRYLLEYTSRNTER